MAPEQADGSRQPVGPPTDVYSLGAILYYLLAGRPPFVGVTPFETMGHVVNSEAEPPSKVRRDVPRDLAIICMHCLSKQPSRRYPTAEALADDLRHFLKGEPITARPVSELERLWKWVKRRPAIAGMLAIVALVMLLATAVSLHFGIKAQRGEHSARVAEGQAREAETDARHVLGLANKAQHDASLAEGQARASETEAKNALARARAVQREADTRAAKLTFNAALTECEAGAVDKGVFLLLQAWRELPPEEHAFRRAIRANLDAWGGQLPVLQQVFMLPQRQGGSYSARFLGSDSKSIFTIWSNTEPLAWRADAATGQLTEPPLNFPDGGPIVDVSADGTVLSLKAGPKQPPQLRNLATGERLKTDLRPHPVEPSVRLSGLTLSRSGHVGYSRFPTERGKLSGLLAFWDLNSGEALPLTYRLQENHTFHVTPGSRRQGRADRISPPPSSSGSRRPGGGGVLGPGERPAPESFRAGGRLRPPCQLGRVRAPVDRRRRLAALVGNCHGAA